MEKPIMFVHASCCLEHEESLQSLFHVVRYNGEMPVMQNTTFDDAYWFRYFAAAAMQGKICDPNYEGGNPYKATLEVAQKMLDAIHEHEAKGKK